MSAGEKNSTGCAESADVKHDNQDVIKETSSTASEPVDQEETSSSGSSESESDLEEAHTELEPHPSTDIHQRLTSFFSQLAEQRANPVKDEKFEEDSSDSGFEDESSGKQYVQFDLALGVLSEAEHQEDEVKLHRQSSKPETDTSDEDQDRIEKLKKVTDASAKKRKHGKKRKIEELG